MEIVEVQVSDVSRVKPLSEDYTVQIFYVVYSKRLVLFSENNCYLLRKLFEIDKMKGTGACSNYRAL
jgi:hypothetical protein